MTSAMAGLTDGLHLNSGGLANGQLSCLWGTSVPNADITIASPPAQSDDTGFQTADVPALKRINATAKAKTTSIAAGSATLFISTFVVTSGQVQITVSSSSESRQDEQVETAAVAIAERLHA